MLYLTFFIGFGFVLLLANPKPPRIKITEVHAYKENKLYNLFLLIVVCLLVIYVVHG